MNIIATGEGTSWWAQSVKKCVYSDYVHTDRLGSVVNLTDQYGRVPAQVDYDDWGKVTAYQSLNISGGYRTVLPEITYAGHQYDDVLNMYYAKARMYDAENRRFTSVDLMKGNIADPLSLVQYLYVVDNPLRWVDPDGQKYSVPELAGGGSSYTVEEVKKVQTGLKKLGYYADSIEGVYTSNTQKAVCEFQKFYTDVPDTGKIDDITIQKIELVVNQATSLPSGNSPTPVNDYNSKLNCSDTIMFDTVVYEGFAAIQKIFEFAGKAGIGILSAKAIVAALTIAGAATAGSADVIMAITLVPAFMKAIADTGVYGALTINAAICFAIDGGFVIGEASYDTPVSAIVSVVGYPCLLRLEK